MSERMFSHDTLAFLDELAVNNNRAWFDENRARYESVVQRPALAFITAMQPILARIAPNFRADPRKAGGSLMRVHRDTRFARDKSPYKTNVGIQFRHALGKDVHAPGLYLHIATDECFLGAGCWHPEPDALGRIRDRLAARPEEWFNAAGDRKFAAAWSLSGDALTRPPRGYAADHPAIEDLKRKDFIGILPLSRDDVTAPGLVKSVGAHFGSAAPLMRFLCAALDVPY